MSKSKLPNIKSIKVDDFKLNSDNPRNIQEDKFKKLVQSIKDFPEMLNLRPIVIDENMTILGGNMRYRACREAGLKEIPAIKISDLSDDQKKEFIIKDNVSFGQWEWDMLSNEWNSVQLGDWGVDLWKNQDDYLDMDDVDIKDDDTKVESDNDDYSKLELVMLYENKLKFMTVIKSIQEDNELEKLEDAIMILTNTYLEQ